MPRGCDDLTWARETGTLEDKHLYVCHAELNAIVDKKSADVKGCTMYVTLFPCNECAKLIIQEGLKKVVYLCDKYKARIPFQASRKLLEEAEIEFTDNNLSSNDLSREHWSNARGDQAGCKFGTQVQELWKGVEGI
ncbi:unnamed protein product [Boreogadus saida]